MQLGPLDRMSSGLCNGSFTMTYASLKRVFEEMERRGEFTASIGRSIIALTLLTSILLSAGSGPASHPLTISAFVYACLSVIGILMAMRQIHSPIFPYLFAAIDMGIAAFALTMLAQMHNLSVSHEFSLPLFSLSFVFLIHASLRYRPNLIIFSFLTFLLFLFALPPIMNVPFVSSGLLHKTHGHAVEKVSSLLLHDIGYLPILFLSAATVLLFMIVKRTRSITELALRDAQKASQLSRFFSPGVVERLIANPAGHAQSGSRVDVAILFIDIRGFSKIAENLPPEKVSEFLSEYRTRVCEIILKHGGTVDKFIGDAVLAVFGAPVSHESDAENAFNASLEIDRELSRWNSSRNRSNLPPIEVGIGGHYGEVFAGIVEAGQILEHTVLGDAVNVSERLERLTRELKSKFIFSDALVSASGTCSIMNGFEILENVQIRGHSDKLKIWYRQKKAY